MCLPALLLVACLWHAVGVGERAGELPVADSDTPTHMAATHAHATARAHTARPLKTHMRARATDRGRRTLLMVPVLTA